MPFSWHGLNVSPYRRFFPLRTSATHARLVVGVPRTLYVGRGIVYLLTAALAPSLIVAVTGIPATGGERVGAILLLAAGAIGFIVGATHILFARRWARRTEVSFDRVTNIVHRVHPPASVNLHLAAAVRIRDRRSIHGWWALDVVGIDGLPLLVVYDRLPAQYAREMAHIVEEMSAWLRNPTSD